MARDPRFDICLDQSKSVLSPRRKGRMDEYGGSPENWARLIREVSQGTKETIGDSCAVAIRFGVEELEGSGGLTCDGEGREVVELLAALPDFWDVNISSGVASST